jgi:hypothetical protein
LTTGRGSAEKDDVSTDRHRRIGAVATVLIVAALAGCGSLDVFAGRADETARLHKQADAALARWAAGVEAAGGKQDFVPTEGMTGQVGDWEVDVGDNNKPALMAGLVDAAIQLPDAVPPAGEIRWNDATTKTVATISAAQALRELHAASEGSCPECKPLQVIGARMSTAKVQTSRGPAPARAWEFVLNGTTVLVTRIAVAARRGVSVEPPPWDANNPPSGLRIDSATGTIGGPQLTVSFIGAPDGADKPCGADYAAEAVEADLAVVIIVTAHSNPFPGACRAVGAVRTATAALARALGDRAVLDVMEGRPVPVQLAP